MSVGLFVTNGGFIDLSLLDTGLESDDGLETAVLISLFSDGRVLESELPTGVVERRGWWGDLAPEVEGDRIGSKLWLLDRSKVLPATAGLAEEYVRAALAWMIEDGLATAILVEAEFIDADLSVTVEISRSNGPTGRYSLRWDAQGLVRG